MAIDRVGPGSGIPGNNPKIKKVNHIPEPQEKSKVNISREAKKNTDILRLTKAVKEAPDIRLDRVEEVKRKLQDPNYINRTVVEELADKLMDSFGI